MAKRELSDRQKNILIYIDSYVSKSGRPPTIREIGKATEISSTSVVNYNLNKLREKGFLLRDAEVSRGLQLTEKALKLYGTIAATISESLIRLPLAGNIVAGEPIWLTPERWQAARLARLAQAETLKLSADLDALATLMDAEMPNPVSAMLLAQAVYAHQRTGTSATATARQAAIVAAEMVARYTAGSADFTSAANALDIAYLRLAPLGSPTAGQSGP